MKVGFHPVIDNPVRMGYVPGWSRVADLVERVGDLRFAIGAQRVVPARWEPYYKECPSCRHAAAYEWARAQLQEPARFAVALALFPGEGEQLRSRIGHANWQILCTRSETSRVTRKLMLTEALELWESEATDWLEDIVERCATQAIQTCMDALHRDVLEALRPLSKDVPFEEVRPDPSDFQTGLHGAQAVDRELLQLDGWTPDPGIIVLPVDGRSYSLKREILLLDLQKIGLLRGAKLARSVAWEKVTLVHVFEGAVTFQVVDEPPLIVSGYRHPEEVLGTVLECQKAATERFLQAVAAHLIRPTP
jgi:hypothetical protein